MNFETETQSVYMTKTLVDVRDDCKQNDDVNKTRRRLLIVLSIQLGLVMCFILGTVIIIFKEHDRSSYFYYSTLAFQLEKLALQGATAIIFLSIYIILTIKYHRSSILVFAWILLICFSCIFLIIVIRSISSLITSNYRGELIRSSLIIIAIATPLIILEILTIKFSFDFVNKIKAHKKSVASAGL